MITFKVRYHTAGGGVHGSKHRHIYDNQSMLRSMLAWGPHHKSSNSWHSYPTSVRLLGIWPRDYHNTLRLCHVYSIDLIKLHFIKLNFLFLFKQPHWPSQSCWQLNVNNVYVFEHIVQSHNQLWLTRIARLIWMTWWLPLASKIGNLVHNLTYHYDL